MLRTDFPDKIIFFEQELIMILGLNPSILVPRGGSLRKLQWCSIGTYQTILQCLQHGSKLHLSIYDEYMNHSNFIMMNPLNHFRKLTNY